MEMDTNSEVKYGRGYAADLTAYIEDKRSCHESAPNEEWSRTPLSALEVLFPEAPSKVLRAVLAGTRKWYVHQDMLFVETK